MYFTLFFQSTIKGLTKVMGKMSEIFAFSEVDDLAHTEVSICLLQDRDVQHVGLPRLGLQTIGAGQVGVPSAASLI